MLDVRHPVVSFAPPGPSSPAATTTPPRSLDDLLAQARQCYAPQVRGEETMAGRRAYVLDLGPSSCAAGYTQSGGTTVAATPLPVGEQSRRTVWVDTETFIALKTEIRGADGTLLGNDETTLVEYDVPLPDALLAFAPPAGTLVVDYRPRTWQPQAGVSVPEGAIFERGPGPSPTPYRAVAAVASSMPPSLGTPTAAP